MSKKANPKLRDSDVVLLAARRLHVEREAELHQHIMFALYHIKRVNATHYNGILRQGRFSAAWGKFMEEAEQRIAEARALREEEETA